MPHVLFDVFVRLDRLPVQHALPGIFLVLSRLLSPFHSLTSLFLFSATLSLLSSNAKPGGISGRFKGRLSGSRHKDSLQLASGLAPSQLSSKFNCRRHRRDDIKTKTLRIRGDLILTGKGYS